MKIQSKTLILITKSNFGGAQRFVLEQAIKLKKEGSDVLVVFGGNGNLKNHLEECEISYLSLANLEKRLDFKGDFMILLNLLKIYRSENPSEIYLNSSKMGFLGSLAGVIYKIFYFKKIKIYFTVHGWVFNEDLKKTTKFLYKLISYWTILNCNKVFVLSKFEFNQMKNWPWAKNKLETIKLQTNVLESDFIPKENARDYFAKNLGLNKNKKWIVTIAEINSNKNLSLGIKALKEIKEKNNSNFIWIIIGEGENYEKIANMI